MRVRVKVSPSRVSSCTYCNPACLALGVDDAVVKPLSQHRPIIYCVTFAAGNVLFSQGSHARYGYDICSGMVKLTTQLRNGQPRIVRLLREGDAAGMEALVDDAYHLTAVAITEVRACAISARELRQWDNSEPRFHHLLLERWLRSQDQTDDIIAQLSTGTAEARVVRLLIYLLAHQNAVGECLCHALSRSDMGALLGVTTETVSRIVAQFKRKGLIGHESNESFPCNLTELTKRS